MHSTWKTAIVAMMATAGLALTALPASASSASTLGQPPSCLKLRHTTGWATQTLYVTNDCRNRVHYYIDKEGPNSPCYSLRAGKSQKHKWTMRDHYHGTYTC